MFLKKTLVNLIQTKGKLKYMERNTKFLVGDIEYCQFSPKLAYKFSVILLEWFLKEWLKKKSSEVNSETKYVRTKILKESETRYY